MESPPGQVNWTRYNPDLRPNEARLRSLQAVAHGADGVFYFHWRAFRNGAEQYHSAILPHDGIPGRAYREASALGAELSQLHSLLDGTTVRAEVAIIEDMASYWALQHQPHNAALADPRRYVRPWYNALRRRNVAVEFCQPDEDLSDYRLVIAPALHVVTPAVAGNLRRYVENGGLLIIGPRSGFKEPSNRVTDLPLPGLLGDLAGVRVAEWAALPPGQTRSLCGSDGVLTGTRASVELWRELLELRGATAAAWYLGGAEDGQVAAARHRLGAGEVYYIGAMSDTLSDTLVDAVLRQRGIDGAAATPEGVEACVREGATGRFLFLLNHTDREQTVALEQHWSALDGGTPLDEVRIAPLDVRVFKELGVRG
jgi:beta-galactosidase